MQTDLKDTKGAQRDAKQPETGAKKDSEKQNIQRKPQRITEMQNDHKHMQTYSREMTKEHKDSL